ncbi:MAG: WecB/TagA/CpsF family glycosyltransferase [Candidatus Falkowbacteria bacterium]
MENINILGINISSIDKDSLWKKIGGFLSDGGQHYIVTPNPEIILAAQKDEEFWHILNHADLALPDGIGLKFAAWALGFNLKRVTGADLTAEILKMAEDQHRKIAVLNWRKSLSRKEDIEAILRSKYPKLDFAIEEIDREWSMPFYQNINVFQPEIIFVALGAPWQEKFIYGNLPKMPFVKLAVGVGGAFDFLTGRIKRAPGIVRAAGFEWLWRVFREVGGRRLWRLRRIYDAAVIFPLKFIKWRFIQPFLYRPSVACLLFKNENGKYRILLTERKDEPGHWQLPQGGTDGEGVETAGTRELSEELNTNKFKPLVTFKNLWKYKFNDKTGKYKTNRHIGYRGQKQSLFIAEFIGKDGDIKPNYWDHAGWKWVDSEKLVEEAHEVRRKAAKIYLEKFNKTINKQ